MNGTQTTKQYVFERLLTADLDMLLSGKNPAEHWKNELLDQVEDVLFTIQPYFLHRALSTGEDVFPAYGDFTRAIIKLEQYMGNMKPEADVETVVQEAVERLQVAIGAMKGNKEAVDKMKAMAADKS